MFRDLIPQLADRFRLVAPNPPVFWQSDMRGAGRLHLYAREYRELIDRFAEMIGLGSKRLRHKESNSNRIDSDSIVARYIRRQ
jgi:hypothetical protein